MPGIVGYCSTGIVSPHIVGEMVSAIKHESWYEVAEARSGGGSAFACVHLGQFDHGVVARSADGKVGVVLDGWLFDAPACEEEVGAANFDGVDAAERCLNLYLELGTDFVRSWNAQCNLLVWDDRRGEVFLINDRYGLRPWHYASFDGALYFAPEAKAIFAGSRRTPKLNQQAVVNQLSLGRIWVGQETLFEGVSVLPPASVLRWHSGAVTVNQYWDYRYEPISEVCDAFIDQTIETFRRAVARQTCAPRRYGVSLSGGLDSRTLLAAFSPHRGRDLRAYSWGVSEQHDEIKIARQTAAELGVPWRYLPLTPAQFISYAAQGVRISEGLDLAVQSYGLHVFPVIREQTDVLLTGLALDMTLGGTYLSAASTDADASEQDAFASVLKQATLFPAEECASLLRFKETSEILEELRGQAFDEWRTGPNANHADQSERFVLRARVARYIFARQRWQRMYVEDVAPTFDNEFFDLLLRIPQVWRADHRFYREFLRRLDSRMMEIPYQRTLLPPAAPVEFWKASAKLEEQREQLYRRLWRDTNGEVFVPYTRYSTNYDEWLRRDPAWLNATDDLLMSGESRSCEAFLNREHVANLVQDHRTGRSANHKKIIQLMTFELFLRQFIG